MPEPSAGLGDGDAAEVERVGEGQAPVVRDQGVLGAQSVGENKNAAYYYRGNSVVCLCVCLYVTTASHAKRLNRSRCPLGCRLKRLNVK